MSHRFRPVCVAIGAILYIAAAPSFAADSAQPQVDVSKPHVLPAVPKCGPTGVAVVAVHVNELGKPFDVRTAQSSGCEALDSAAEYAVRGWRFVPASRDESDIAEWTAVGFQFDGKAVTQVDVPPETEVSRRDRDQVVCRTQAAATGSHINQGRVCMTKEQWDEIRLQREQARKHEHVPTTLGTGGSTQASH